MKANRTLSERRRRRSWLPRNWLIWTLWFFVVAVGVGSAGIVYVIEKQGRAPRDWAPYLMRRAEGHNPLVVKATTSVTTLLEYMDRIPGGPPRIPPGWVGAERGPVLSAQPESATHRHLVGSIDALNAALNNAMPGDIIELLPGQYRVDGRGLQITRPGQPDAPITLRSPQLGLVVIEGGLQEVIKVFAPDWHFENLVIRGLCGPEADSYCEHAFHVVGAAQRTVIRNNILIDFNAQIKINGEDGKFPDSGIIDHNTLIDSRPRATANPVTPVDLDAASGWHITGNLITDFIKSGGDGVSYGGYAKAAGDDNVFERNVVLCENQLSGAQGQRIGLSLGGGGSGESIRRDNGHSGLEHKNGRISDNLIAFCSDAGIYINKAVDSEVKRNTIIDTSGIEVRFPQSSAEIDNNIIDGVITVRDGATMRAEENDVASLIGLFIGWHPQRRLFVDVANFDLRWRGTPPRTSTPEPTPDLCGAARPPRPVIGAFEDYTACLTHSTH